MMAKSLAESLAMFQAQEVANASERLEQQQEQQEQQKQQKSESFVEV